MLEQHPDELLLFYNSNFDYDRKMLAHAESNFKYVRAFDIARQPVKGTVLEELAMRLNMQLSDLLRTEATEEMPPLGSDTDYIKMIQHNPDLLRTPIAVSHTKAAVIGAPGDFAKV